jgi:hypothetical protein
LRNLELEPPKFNLEIRRTEKWILNCHALKFFVGNCDN